MFLLSFRKIVLVSREFLIHSLKNYTASSEDEISFRDKFLELLEHPDAFQRYHLPGHITGSAWIVDFSKQFVLLTHHAKLNKWLQPGGHADGEEDALHVAVREATEETGIKEFKPLYSGIFDIDIHTIPQRKEFPEHLHYDIRFLLEADKNEALLITEESHA
ncbi:MAG: NUDIX hydrolase, partial [Marivirga sp.]|nr:NUDIX hydrolase [Marivirga sp.]